MAHTNLKQGVNYKWDSNAVFTMTAQEFGALYNGLNAIVTSQSFKEKLSEAQSTISIVNLHSTMNNILSTAVTNGVAIEETADDKPMN